jgi:hypothetical protein
MRQVHFSKALAAVLIATATFASIPKSTFAQTMPNNAAWLNAMVGRQITLQRQGTAAVRAIFLRCYIMSARLRARGIDPGNCGATRQSASAAINRLNLAQQSYIAHSQRDANATQQSIDNFDHRAIRDCTKLTDSSGTPYWSCSNGNASTLTGH